MPSATAVVVAALLLVAPVLGQLNPAFECENQPSGLAGGWRPVMLPDNNVDLDSLGARAAGLYLGTNPNMTECQSGNIQNLTSIVHTACSQVVAGTNYGLTFDAYYTCLGANNQTLNGTFPLQAVVFVPLQRLAEAATVADMPQVTVVQPSP